MYSDVAGTVMFIYIMNFITELPSLLPITEVAETLLHMPNGNLLLNRLVANVPDSFHDGKSLLLFDTRQITDRKVFVVVIHKEGLAGPSRAYTIRLYCLQ